MSCHSPNELLGMLLAGRYRVVQHLATGGVSHIYAVEDEAVSEKVKPWYAVKILQFEHLEVGSLRIRFSREIEANLRMKSRHVPTLFHHGVLSRCQAPLSMPPLSESAPYFVAELLRGADIADLLQLSRCLAPLRTVQIAIQAARGLHEAHAARVVHRDLKPENIFLTRAADGSLLVKLLDFGFSWIDNNLSDIASDRLTLPTSPVGTPEYMAPEQALGDIGRPPADIYSLGIVLFEMLTGSVPFHGAPRVLLEKHLHDPLPSMDRGSRELQSVVRRALEKDPSNRYESAAAMALALTATPEGQQLSV